jgi:hypothetical protein
VRVTDAMRLRASWLYTSDWLGLMRAIRLPAASYWYSMMPPSASTLRIMRPRRS